MVVTTPEAGGTTTAAGGTTTAAGTAGTGAQCFCASAPWSFFAANQRLSRLKTALLCVTGAAVK